MVCELLSNSVVLRIRCQKHQSWLLSGVFAVLQWWWFGRLSARCVVCMYWVNLKNYRRPMINRTIKRAVWCGGFARYHHITDKAQLPTKFKSNTTAASWWERIISNSNSWSCGNKTDDMIVNDTCKFDVLRLKFQHSDFVLKFFRFQDIGFACWYSSG